MKQIQGYLPHERLYKHIFCINQSSFYVNSNINVFFKTCKKCDIIYCITIYNNRVTYCNIIQLCTSLAFVFKLSRVLVLLSLIFRKELNVLYFKI